jgi:16S rRNA (guanine527-N7)-methyltransferase
MSVNEQRVLTEGAQAMGLALSDAQAHSLIRYMDLLQQWGSVYNLTAVRDREDMLRTHLLDCLAVVQPLRAQIKNLPEPRLLDVGAGAGLPGVALAICLPELQVRCIDTVAKKAAFIQQAGLQLGLKNLKAIHGRVEKHADTYDVVTSRAFASLVDFVSWTKACLAKQGVWMAMKGKLPQDELDALSGCSEGSLGGLHPSGVDVFHVEPLSVPGLDAERCLIWMRPRSQGMAQS